MKKPAKTTTKLSLDRDTVRVLTDAQLATACGGTAKRPTAWTCGAQCME